MTGRGTTGAGRHRIVGVLGVHRTLRLDGRGGKFAVVTDGAK